MLWFGSPCPESVTSVDGRYVSLPWLSMERTRSVIIIFSGRVNWNFVGCGQKLLQLFEIVISGVTVIAHWTTHSGAVKFILAWMQGRRSLCCVYCDNEFVTCDWHISQPKDCSTWKESGLVWYYFSRWDVYCYKIETDSTITQALACL